MLKSTFTRLSLCQRIFKVHISTRKEVYRQGTFNNEDIPKITVPHRMVKKLERIKFKKILEDSKKMKYYHHTDLVITCNRKEFNHYKHQIYKDISVKDLASGGWLHYKSKNDYFTILPRMKNPALLSDHKSFKELGLNEKIVEVIEGLGFEKPTNIQSKAIPFLLKGRSVHVAAETGNGKTLAFLLPIFDKILNVKKITTATDFNQPVAVVIVPSRELADQIYNVACDFAEKLGINVDLKCGGRGTKGIIQDFEVKPIDLVIATPGIFSKLLSNKYYRMNRLSMISLDEVDTLFDASFVDVMTHILIKMKMPTERLGPLANSLSNKDDYDALPTNDNYDALPTNDNYDALPTNDGDAPPTKDEYGDGLPDNKNTLSDLQIVLTGATTPKGVHAVMQEILEIDDAELVTTPYLNHILPHISQKFIRLKSSGKDEHLINTLKENIAKKLPTMVFCNKPDTVRYVGHVLRENDIPGICFHGDMTEQTRGGKFESYQKGDVDVMVCTDIASRGLDTIRTRQVINYDFPGFVSDYIHRAGRVGRMGSPNGCLVLNYVAKSWEVDLLWKIETSVRRNEMLFNVNANIKKKLEGIHSSKGILAKQQQLLDEPTPFHTKT